MNYRSKLVEMLSQCMQCGTCTGSCPNALSMDQTPRKLWRMVAMERFDDIWRTRTFSLCSTCYFCTLRCPRGLELTRAMSLLKHLALREKVPGARGSSLFYTCFIDSVRGHGRVRESEFMGRYLVAMGNPLLPFRFAPLGVKLLSKGKVSLFPPSNREPGSLDGLFTKALEIEEES